MGDTASPAAAGSTTVPTATDLAASQITSSTVTAPAIAGLCDPAQIEVRTADPGVDADQVIDLINRSDVACEVDVSGSPDASEDLEPNVVLGPEGVGYLWVSEVSACGSGDADKATEFELRVNGVSRVVPLTFVPLCGIELWALFTD